MLKRIPIFWIVFIALLATSALPLGFLAFNSIRTTERGVEAEQANQLEARVEAHAQTIEQQLNKFATATVLAAAQAKEMLLGRARGMLTDAQIDERMLKYARDSRGTYGLDDWYAKIYKPQKGDNRISDAFLNKNTELTQKIRYDIAVTEDLNPIFASIADANIGTQWIYLTTAEGMIRLYPWAGNADYPDDWQPQTLGFYTVAAADRNPKRIPAWTNPYNDAAGAGIMITNSVPIYDGDTLIAVMSHDLLIQNLQSQILNFKIGQAGYAFLIDNQGNLIVHKDYPVAADTKPGEELTIKLADKNANMTNVVNAMVKEPTGITNYKDADGHEWMVAFSQVPSTNWHLGVVQPRDEIIAPAIEIRRQTLPVAASIIALVLVGAILLARWIARPLFQLSSTAQQIEAAVDQENQQQFNAASLSNIGGTQEISRLSAVFGQMVSVLQQRMRELNSVYRLGQAVTANVDFDATVQAVLESVRQVVDSDAAEVILLKDNNQLVVEGWQGKEGFNNTVGRKFKMGEGLVGMVASTREISLMETIMSADLKSTLADASGALAREMFLRTTKLVINSFLGLPMIIGDRLIGVLALVDHEPGHFTEADKRQLSKLIAQASIAIDNAVKVREREVQLQKQIESLRIEIDEAKKSRQIAEITESDFFKDLQGKATRMRQRAKSITEESNEGEGNSNDDPTLPKILNP
jgi:putative methionine-R-sulfoxide reductase with GAF domain